MNAESSERIHEDNARSGAAAAVAQDHEVRSTTARRAAAEPQNGRPDETATADMNTPAITTASAPPAGWRFRVPLYRASRNIEPAEKVRFRFEPPFATMADGDVWQYAHKSVERGEVIATRFWPHPSFQPLNYSAFRVLDFFNARQKSRLPWRPWQFDRVRLDDGLTGSMQPKIQQWSDCSQ